MAADTFACISQYVALATGDCDVLADGVVGGRLALRTHGYAATREAAMAIASTPCSPLPATTWALGYNEDRRQLQLMDGWQASEAWRADLRAEYT